MQNFQTPTKAPQPAPSLTEVYRSSLRKPVIEQRMCLLCLLCSPDCDNTRCADPRHVTCRECSYEWDLDRECPVCKRDSFNTLKKPRRGGR